MSGIPQTTWSGGGGFGDTSRPWEDIAATFRQYSTDPARDDLVTFAERVATSPYAAAGLCGMTSHLDLIVGMSREIRDNPHLVIRHDRAAGQFAFEYRDGSAKPWTRLATGAEVYDVFERFLTKRARWFTRTPAR